MNYPEYLRYEKIIIVNLVVHRSPRCVRSIYLFHLYMSHKNSISELRVSHVSENNYCLLSGYLGLAHAVSVGEIDFEFQMKLSSGHAVALWNKSSGAIEKVWLCSAWWLMRFAKFTKLSNHQNDEKLTRSCLKLLALHPDISWLNYSVDTNTWFGLNFSSISHPYGNMRALREKS